jgi:hypothetical protein
MLSQIVYSLHINTKYIFFFQILKQRDFVFKNISFINDISMTDNQEMLIF